MPEKTSKNVVRKNDPDYIRFGFTMAGSEDHPKLQCVECGEVLSNEALKPSKRQRNLSTKHPLCVGRNKEYFERRKHMLKTQQKAVKTMTTQSLLPLGLAT